ncbi:15034_t:CDS:2 [Rhizophagus irregularis]|nr:15034_t:CDS:2 [Rhizophagus irregularis]
MMNSLESDKENEVIVKVSITENEVMVITQEMELKTEKQRRTYERIIRELQNFMIDTIYENYEQRFERKMSKVNIEDDNESKNNEDNDSENIAEHDEYNNDLKIGKTIIIITIMEIENCDNNNIRNGNIENIIDQENNNNENQNNEKIMETNDNADDETIHMKEKKMIEQAKEMNINLEGCNNFSKQKFDWELRNGRCVNRKKMYNDENQELRVNFENGDGKKRIIDKTKKEGIDEESEDIIKLFRKMERNKLKQIINGYQFAKMVIKEREE